MRRSSPFDDLFDVFRDFDSLFRRTFGDLAPLPAGSGRLLTSGASGEGALAPVRSAWPGFTRWSVFPAVESFVKDNRLHVRAEVPGVDPSDLNVTVTGNVLAISGEKKASRDVDEADVHGREISYGRFERQFTLPEGVRTEEMKARFENGVLEVTMPAPEQARQRKIQIEAAPVSKVKAA